MTKAKPAKTSRAAKKLPAAAKAPVKAPAKASVSTKAKVAAKPKTQAPKKAAAAKVKVVPTQHKADWSGAIRQALQEKQAPKTWPGGGHESWKGAPTRKN